MSTLALYPGSFDPFTLGHLDVAHRASELFGRLHILVVHNPGKSPRFDIEQRAKLIEAAIQEAGLQNVTVGTLKTGLLTEACKNLGATVIVKGLRNTSDVANELPQAFVNRDLSGIETIYLPAAPETSYISSTLVRQVAELGGDISTYVPTSVREAYTR